MSLASLGLFLAIVFILFLVSPHLSYTGQGIKRSWVVYCLWLMTVYCGKPSALKNLVLEVRRRRLEVFFILFWLLVVLINAALEHGNTWDLHLIIMISMCMVFTVQLYYVAQRDGSYESFLKAFLLILGFEIINSLPMLWSNPAVARMLTGGIASPEEVVAAGKAGVGQYGYYTGLAIVLPAIVTQAIINRGFARLLLWIIIGVIVLAIAISTFMGAILLMASGFLFLAFFHIIYARSRLKVTILYGALLLCFFLAWEATISDLEQGTYIAKKLEAQFTAVARVGIIEGDKTKRADTWKSSWNTFLENPLFGIGATTNRDNPDLGVRVGAHSAWIDQLAEYGILGFGPYLMFLGFAIRRIVIAFRTEKTLNRYKIIYLGQLVSCSLFIIGGTYNPVVVITEVFVFFCLFGIR